MGFIESRRNKKAERAQVLRSSTLTAVELLNEEKLRAIIPDVAPLIVTEKVAEVVRCDMREKGQGVIFLGDRKVRKVLEELSNEKSVKPGIAKDEFNNEVQVWGLPIQQRAKKRSLSSV